MQVTKNIAEANACITQGGIIAYPTEAVYGLGCDPFSEASVQKLLALKGRSEAQGLILIIAHWFQLWPLIDRHAPIQFDKICAFWPGHYTWLFPKSTQIPQWISGRHSKVAIRMTNHPVARSLCGQSPLVSTSANLTGKPAAHTVSDVKSAFSHLDLILDAPLGSAENPSQIFDALTGEQLR